MQEAQRLMSSRKPGITLVGFKPLSKLDVSYHLEAPKFVTYDESEFIGMCVKIANSSIDASLLNIDSNYTKKQLIYY